jgi:hypothetical protein
MAAAWRRAGEFMEFWARVADWTAGNWQALVGYGASVVILLSLVTANVLKLRPVNGIGPLLFGWYGLLFGSWRGMCWSCEADRDGLDAWDQQDARWRTGRK